MPRGSTAKGAMHMHIEKFARHQRACMRQRKRDVAPEPDFVPSNRNERRALAAVQRKQKTP